MPDPTTTRLQLWLGRLNDGDNAARDELFRHAGERLRRLARRMFQHDFPRLRQFEETDDVFQTALLRLHRALADVRPATVTDFYRLAGVQLRRVLVDLARHYFGPQGAGGKLQKQAESDSREPAFDGESTTYEPAGLVSWSEFHQAVEGLPEEEKAVFDLLWYQEQTLPDAAETLGVSLSTVKRRWLAARLRLQDLLQDENTPAE